MLFPHQLRHYNANIFHVQSNVAAALVVALIAAISSGGVHAEYFIPTSLGGSLSYGYGYTRVAESESEQSNVVLSVNGSGYFWQPWFLTMGAGVGLGLSKADGTSSSGSTGKSISGGADFTLFPESRFPTSFGFGVSDSRQEINDNIFLNGQHAQTRRFYIRQTYNTLDGTNINAWFNHNAGSTSFQPGESIDRSVGFQIRKRVPYHDFELGGGFFETLPADSDFVSSNYNLLLAHNYTPSAEVGVSSSASYSGADSTGGGLDKFSSAYEQLSSSFYWRPEHRPYFISGGALIYNVLNGVPSRGVSTNANASYQFSHNISVSAGLGVSVSDAGGNQSLNATQSISTNIPSEQYTIFSFDYGWNIGMGFSNSMNRNETSTVTEGGSNTTETKNHQSLNVSASHHLSRSINLGRNSSVNTSLGQSVSASKSSDSDYVSRSLSSSASLGWNHNGFGGNTSAGASISDSHSFGQDTNSFQVASAQLARNQELSRLSALSGSINFQASRSQVDESNSLDGGEHTTKSASASFNYGHGRFLGVHGLIFNSTLSVPALLKDDRTHSTAGKTWDNTLAYRIGLLSLNMTGRIAESGPGQRAYSMTFQAVRSF